MGKLRINIPAEENFIDLWIQVTSGITQLTDTQQKVLAELLKADSVECTTEARKAVTEKLGFKNLAVTANFIKILKDKKVLVKNPETGKLGYASIINPPSGTSSLEFVFSEQCLGTN